MDRVPDKEKIEKAHAQIKPFIHETPVLTSKTIEKISGAEVFFKCENFQKTGSFKIRGATNAILSLSKEELAKGVVTHSSGNHAQALALAAKRLGTNSFIVMPKNAPTTKKKAVIQYGGRITECESNLESRRKTLQKIVEKTGAKFIPPYDCYDIIAGQATCCKELIDAVSGLNFILVPIGGGGLASGTLLAAKYFSPQTKVIGCEPSGADDAYRSFYAGHLIPSINPSTIADGLLTSLSDKTFKIIKQEIHDILTVSDNQIIKAMRLIWERMKILIEPSGAVAVAVLLAYPKIFRHQRIGVILSGGNMDLDKLPF